MTGFSEDAAIRPSRRHDCCSAHDCHSAIGNLNCCSPQSMKGTFAMPDQPLPKRCCHDEQAEAITEAEQATSQESRRDFLRGSLTGGTFASLGALVAGSARCRLRRASTESGRASAWSEGCPSPQVSLHSGDGQNRSLGLLQQIAQASPRNRFGRLRHDRDADSPRQRRRGTHDQRRSRLRAFTFGRRTRRMSIAVGPGR